MAVASALISVKAWDTSLIHRFQPLLMPVHRKAGVNEPAVTDHTVLATSALCHRLTLTPWGAASGDFLDA